MLSIEDAETSARLTVRVTDVVTIHGVPILSIHRSTLPPDVPTPGGWLAIYPDREHPYPGYAVTIDGVTAAVGGPGAARRLRRALLPRPAGRGRGLSLTFFKEVMRWD